MTELDALPVAWREVFDLMWEAYAAGTVPVGAAVVDEAGVVVSRGRNRIFDVPSVKQIARSGLAHAEINAVIGLPSDRTYEHLTLLTTLEPCHLCLSAAVTVRLGSLHYAAPDPYGGAVGKLCPSHDHRAHPVDIQGPLEGLAGRLPEALAVAHFLWRVPDGSVVGFYRDNRPEVIAAAQRLPNPVEGTTLAEAALILDSG